MRPRWLGWVFAALCVMALLEIGDDATVSSHVGASIHLSSNPFFSAIDRVVSLTAFVIRTSDESSALVRASMNEEGPAWLGRRGPPGCVSLGEQDGCRPYRQLTGRAAHVSLLEIFGPG